MRYKGPKPREKRMQHPDEGTIHAWLDDALAPGDAARTAAHIAECADCSAAAAEARGFLAASSRILTALDNVPAKVIPVSRKRNVVNSVAWRIAAALLVVATGSVIVLRKGSAPTSATSPTNAAMATSAAPVSESARMDNASVAPPAAAERAAPSRVAARTAATPSLRLPSNTTPVVEKGTRFSESAELPAKASAVESAAPMGYSTADHASDASLKVVSVERTTEGKRTIYEVAPSRTVALTEIETLQLSTGVTTGVGVTGGVRGQAPAVAERESARSSSGGTMITGQLATAPASTPPPKVSAAPASATGLSAPPSAAQAAVGAPAIHRPQPNKLEWTDQATGKRFTLAGDFSVDELKALRQRIEQQRAR